METTTELLTKEETARYLRVGIRTLDRLIATGDVLGARIGGRRLVFRKMDIDRYVQRQLQKAAV